HEGGARGEGNVEVRGGVGETGRTGSVEVEVAHLYQRVVDVLQDGRRLDAVLFVIGALLGAAALGLVEGLLHRVGDAVGVEDDAAVDVAGGAAGGLDQRGLAAQEALLVGVEDGDQGDLRQVETF